MTDQGASRERPVRRVVVPVEGSAEGARALPFAAHLADRLDVPIVVVSVIRDFRSEAADAVATLEEVLADLPAFVDCRVVQSNATGRAISEESRDGLVCMATSGRLFDCDGVHGSTTEFVVATASCPVVALGPACPDEPVLDRVVVAIDPAHEQRRLSSWAVRLAYHLDVPVDFVHVRTDDPADLGPMVRPVPRGEDGSVAGALVTAADGALLAMGSHGRTGMARLLEGSVGAELLGRAPQPVMILGPSVAD